MTFLLKLCMALYPPFPLMPNCKDYVFLLLLTPCPCANTSTPRSPVLSLLPSGGWRESRTPTVARKLSLWARRCGSLLSTCPSRLEPASWLPSLLVPSLSLLWWRPRRTGWRYPRHGRPMMCSTPPSSSHSVVRWPWRHLCSWMMEDQRLSMRWRECWPSGWSGAETNGWSSGKDMGTLRIRGSH